MVNKAIVPEEVNEFVKAWDRLAQGTPDRGRRKYTIILPDALAEQIRAEAFHRQWTFAHMVRHLCEASIDGIE